MRSGIIAALFVLILAAMGVIIFHTRWGLTSNAPVFQPNESMFQSATNPGANAGSSTDATIIPICTSDSQSFDCYKKYYEQLVDSKGVDAAFADLKARYATNSYVTAECHPLTHAIGKEAAGHYATVADAYLHGDSFCWSGYYHGVLEGVIAKIGLANLPARLDTICTDIPGKERFSFDYYNCVHGLGHGIMETESDDVPVSLQMCDNLSGSWEQQSCWSGVFMENIIAYQRDGTSQFLKKSDPLYPCNAIADKYQGECYLGQTSYALQVDNYDFAKVFALCATVKEPYRDICNQSMGRDAAGSTNDIPGLAKIKCDLASDAAARKNCVIGAVKDIISYYHGIDEAKQFCALVNDSDKQTCTDTTSSYFTNF